MEGLCPSKPPRQRPGGLWKPGFGVEDQGLRVYFYAQTSGAALHNVDMAF